LLISKAFLFCAVAVAGMAIISRTPFNRRNRFILTAALSVGFGAILVPNWFSFVFTYKGNNRALLGFFDAIVLVMETGFAVTALLAMLLNLTIGEEVEQDAKQLEGHATEKEIEETRSAEDPAIDQEKAIKVDSEEKPETI
jgi:xanthine/uracil permease